jgi:hypothetical protein
MEKSSDDQIRVPEVLKLHSNLESFQQKRVSSRLSKSIEPSVTEICLDDSENESISSTSKLLTTIDTSAIKSARVEVPTQCAPSLPPRKKRRVSELDDDAIPHTPICIKTPQNIPSTPQTPRSSSSIKRRFKSTSVEELDSKQRELIACPLKKPPRKKQDQLAVLYVFKQEAVTQPSFNEELDSLGHGEKSKNPRTLIISRANPNNPFYHDNSPTFFKVGYTDGEFSKRRDSIEKQCKIRLETVVYTLELPLQEIKRLERLIHVHLEAFKTKYLDSYKKPCQCTTDHQEWFHIRIQTLIHSIDMWHQFMSSKPYHPVTGKLLPFWKTRLQLKEFCYPVDGDEDETNQKDECSKLESNHLKRCKNWKKVLEYSTVEGISRHWPNFQQRIWNLCQLSCILFFIATSFGPFYSALHPYTRGIWGHCYVAFVWAVLGCNSIQTIMYSNY